MEDKKNIFEEIYLSKINRRGADELLEWIRDSDFFDAPASAKYHLNRAGGLCEHSLNVYSRLSRMLQMEYGNDCAYSDEAIAIVSLLHDLCKVYHFEVGWRNQKTYIPEKVAAAPPKDRKRDAAGEFVWETVPAYNIKEDFIYGHGEKSVYLIMKFMKLTDDEAQAIRYHMSSWNSEEARSAGDCYEKNPLAFFLHLADEAATFIDEA